MSNDDQKEFWNSPAADRWLEYSDTIDHLMAALTDELIVRAAPQPGERVLDIGCGGGDVVRRVAQRIGPDGTVTGVDISRPLLALARERLSGSTLPVTFLEADAQTEPFSPQYDLIVSRFGVMFFEDPVAAFQNLRRALASGGRLVMMTWSALQKNPWFEVAGRAAAAHFGAPPPQSAADPSVPGPMAFADTAKVIAILEAAGWQDASAEILSIPLTFPGPATEFANMCTRLGPAARFLRETDGTETDRQAIAATIAATIAEAFAAGMSDDTTTIPAELNLFTARQI